MISVPRVDPSRGTLPALVLTLLVSTMSLTACDTGAPEGLRIGRAPTAESGTGVASPGDDQPARDDLTLMLWHAYRDDEREALETVIARFNDTQLDTTVELLAVPFDAYPDRISAAIPRGRGPDLFIFAHDRVGSWAEDGIVEPINYWTDSHLLSLFFEDTVRALVYERRLFGLPLAYKSLVLYFNRDLVPSPPSTTDELITLAARLTTGEGAGRYGLVYENTKLYFHAPWLHGFGGQVLDGAGGLHIDGPASRQALEFAAGLHRHHHLLPENISSQGVTSLFNQGRAAMVINGPWFRGELEGIDWGVAPLPTIDDTGLAARPFLTVEGLMISAESAHKARAFEVARWLATDADCARTRVAVGHQPVALRAYYDDAERTGQIDPALAVFRDQMLDAIPTPNTPLMRRVWAHMDTALFRAIKNGAPIGEVLGEARERIEAER